MASGTMTIRYQDNGIARGAGRAASLLEEIASDLGGVRKKIGSLPERSRWGDNLSRASAFLRKKEQEYARREQALERLHERSQLFMDRTEATERRLAGQMRREYRIFHKQTGIGKTAFVHMVDTVRDGLKRISLFVALVPGFGVRDKAFWMRPKSLVQLVKEWIRRRRHGGAGVSFGSTGGGGGASFGKPHGSRTTPETTAAYLAWAHSQSQALEHAQPEGFPGILGRSGGVLGGFFGKFFDGVRQKIQQIMAKLEAERKRLAEANKERVFDNDGQFGGDQGSPRTDFANHDAFKDIVEKNTGHRLTDQELNAYLKRANSEGCGYVAMANAIFRAYEGRAKEFEKTFGYPMVVNGELNYNMLFIDVYSSTDNHYKGNSGGDMIDNWDDYNSKKDGPKENYNIWLDPTGKGSSVGDREYFIEKFLNDHGVKVKTTTNVTVTPENFAEVSKGGVIQVAAGDYTMYDVNGVPRKIDGGHAMTVTGVKDGRLEVSSWGKRYYIDLDDKFGRISFQKVVIDA